MKKDREIRNPQLHSCDPPYHHHHHPQYTTNTNNNNNNKFYGRTGELAQLAAALQRLEQSRHTERIVISGAPGVGKSRLWHEFRRSVDPSRAVLFAYGKSEEPLRSGQQHHHYHHHHSSSNHQPTQHDDSETSLSSKSRMDTRRANTPNTITNNNSNTCAAGPLTCLMDACNDLCRQLILQSSSSTAAIMLRDELRQLLLDDGVRSLASLIPELATLLLTQDDNHDVSVEKNNNSSRSGESSSMDATSRKFRLEFLLKAFVSAVGRRYALVLALDDLQWADDATVDWVSKLMVDPDVPGILLVGLVRGHHGERVMERIIHLPTVPQQQQQHPLPTSTAHTIHLEGLGLADIEMLLQDTFLDADDDDDDDDDDAVAEHFHDEDLVLPPESKQEIRHLASKLLVRTHGECFYLCETVWALKRSHLVRCHQKRLIWDAAQLDHFLSQSPELEHCDDDTTNNRNADLQVLLLGKMQSLPERVQWCLALASLFRCPVGLDDFVALLPAVIKDEPDCDELYRDLQLAVNEGLLLEHPTTMMTTQWTSTTMTFVHDRVQEAAHALLRWKLAHGEAYHPLCWRVGMHLVQRSTDPRRFFTGVHHLNAVPAKARVPNQTASSIHTVLVRINATAGEFAARQAAFIPAFRYFDAAIVHLEKATTITMPSWESKKDDESFDTCAIYMQAARIAICLGKIEKGGEWIQTILRHATTTKEKMEANLIWVHGLGVADRHFEAFQAGKEALRSVNEFPRFINPINLMKQLGKIKSLLKRISDDDILSFPMMEDTTRMKTLELMTITASRAYNCQHPLTGIMCLCRQLLVSLKGRVLYPAVAEAFTYWGVLCFGPLNDLVLGKRASDLSIRLLDRMGPEARHLRTRTLSTNLVMIQAWDQPLVKTVETGKAGYKSGMEEGDMEHAFYNMLIHYLLLFCTGEALGEVLHGVDGFCRLAQQYNHRTTLSFLVPVRKMALDLSGASGGSPFYEETGDISQEESRETLCTVWFYMSRAIPAYILGNVELAERNRVKVDKITAVHLNFVTLTNHSFFTSLICMAMYRRTRRRKYRARAKRQLKELKTYMDLRGLKLVHRYYVMDADFTSSTKKGRKNPTKVKSMFDKAIIVCARSGFGHDAALANELAGEYFLRHAGDRKTTKQGFPNASFWAERYLSTAYSMYASWGAKAKAEQMMRHYKDLIHVSDHMKNRGIRLRRSSEMSFLSQISSVHSSMNFAATRASSSDRFSDSSRFSASEGFFNNPDMTMDFSERSVIVGGKSVRGLATMKESYREEEE